MIKLVWRINPDGLFEKEWIYELLQRGGVEYEEVFDLDGNRVFPSAVVVFNHTVDYETYFQKYQDAQVKFGAIHLSDEQLGDTTRFYSHPMCNFVFRNYHHPLLTHHKHVVTFGLGYKTGFARTTNPRETKRYYNWTFAGNSHTPERMECMSPFMKMYPFKVHTTSLGFNASNGLSTDKYRDLMDDSRFVICPIGQGNIDSFRVYEALESGAIPIVVASTKYQPYTPSYWHAIFPWMQASTIPMIIHNNWNDAAVTVARILQLKDVYEEIQTEMIAFWNDAKNIWACALKTYCNSL